MDLARFGVSCDSSLLKEFDAAIQSAGYASRSEAVSDLMRQYLLRSKMTDDSTVVGAVIMVYDHHQRELAERLLDIQHQELAGVIATTHIHLDHHHCLEVLLLKGRAKDVQHFSDLLLSTRGVQRGELVIADFLPDQN